MNYFDKNKFLTAAVVILLISNIFILGFLWFNSSKKNSDNDMPGRERPLYDDRLSNDDRRPPEGGPREFIIQELKLNEIQIQEYDKLIKEHQSGMKSIRENIRREKDDLWSIFSKSEGDTAAAEKIASEIGNYQKQTELITFRHFSKLKELCNEDQKKKFDEIINEALKMMGPGNRPPPGN